MDFSYPIPENPIGTAVALSPVGHIAGSDGSAAKNPGFTPTTPMTPSELAPRLTARELSQQCTLPGKARIEHHGSVVDTTISSTYARMPSPMTSRMDIESFRGRSSTFSTRGGRAGGGRGGVAAAGEEKTNPAKSNAGRSSRKNFRQHDSARSRIFCDGLSDVVGEGNVRSDSLLSNRASQHEGLDVLKGMERTTGGEGTSYGAPVNKRRDENGIRLPGMERRRETPVDLVGAILCVHDAHAHKKHHAFGGVDSAPEESSTVSSLSSLAPWENRGEQSMR